MAAIGLRPSTRGDLDFITTLERQPDNLEHIGQWSDWEHLSAIEGRNGRSHWVIERDGERAGYLIAYDCRAGDAGFYVKRILVERKDGGTGSQALRRFIDHSFSLGNVSCVWLMVREANARGRHIYEKLGFRRFEPTIEEARRYDAFEAPPGDGVLRMRLTPRDNEGGTQTGEDHPQITEIDHGLGVDSLRTQPENGCVIHQRERVIRHCLITPAL